MNRPIWLLNIFFFCFGVTYQAQSQLKIQSLNFNAEAMNQELATARYAILRQYVVDNDLDMILFQEAWPVSGAKTVAVKLAEDLGYDCVYHFEDGVTGVYDTANAIVAKKSLHLRNSVSTKLPHSAFTIGNGTSDWASFGQTNILIGATIDLPNGQVATIWSVHLYSGSQAFRLDQVPFAINFIKQYVLNNKMNWNSTPIFFGGDFNSGDHDPEAGIMRKEFIDSWMVAHPGEPGLTIVNDPASPEYNPMVHSSLEFPSQAQDQGTDRVDYIYTRNLSGVGIGAQRIFTSPISRIWMSDHYSLLCEFGFDGTNPNLPNADSDMSTLGQTTIFSVVNSLAQGKVTMEKDFTVESLRGFTVESQADGLVFFAILNNASQVYNSNFGILGKGDDASFTFFSPGQYKYEMRQVDLKTGKPLEFQFLKGTLTVR